MSKLDVQTAKMPDHRTRMENAFRTLRHYLFNRPFYSLGLSISQDRTGRTASQQQAIQDLQLINNVTTLDAFDSEFTQYGLAFFRSGTSIPTFGTFAGFLHRAHHGMNERFEAAGAETGLVKPADLIGWTGIAFDVDAKEPRTGEYYKGMMDYDNMIRGGGPPFQYTQNKMSGHYEVATDCLLGTDFSKIKEQCPVHVVLSFKPQFDPSGIDTSHVAFYVNSIPSIERSKAIPYLQVEFLSTRKNEAADNTLGTTLARFLNPGKDYHHQDEFSGADWTANDVTLFDQKLNTIASTEIFTAPQTLVSPAYVGTAGNQEIVGVNGQFYGGGNYSDPFRPLLSLESFTLTDQMPSIGAAGPDGTKSKRSASLVLTLHDKKRMKDVAEMLQPGGLETGEALRITWGWSHPNSNNYELSAQAGDVVSSAYGEIMDGFKLSEIFTVSNVSFDISPSGEVKVTIPLMSMGSAQSLKSLPIDSAWDSSDSAIDIMKDLQGISDALNLKKTKKNKLTKTGRQTLVALAGSKPVKTDSLVDENVRESIKKLKTKIAGDLTIEPQDLGEALVSLLESEKESEQASTISSVSRSAYFKEIIKTLKKRLNDPFAVHTPAGAPIINRETVGFLKEDITETGKGGPWPLVPTRNPHTYITLGKVFTAIVGSSLSKAYTGMLEEIQIIFHGFNDSAALASELNIAQFPIRFDTFETLLKKQYSKDRSMSLDAFINFLNVNFIGNRKSPGFGVHNAHELIGKNKYRRLSQGQALNRIYGNPPEYPEKTFRQPHLCVKYCIKPGRFGLRHDITPTSKPILRMEIYDRNGGTGGAYTRALASMSEGNPFFPLRRQANDEETMSNAANTGVACMNHQLQAAIEEGPLLDPELGLARKITSADIDGLNAKVPAAKKSNFDKLTKSLVDHGYVFKTDADTVKKVIQLNYPTLNYGGAATAIESAKVSSIQSKDEVTLAISRRQKRVATELEEEKDEPDVDAILSVYPVQVSLESLGCPFFQLGQKYFIDFETGTDIDNVYTTTKVTHEVKPGEFKTSIDFTLPAAGGTYRTPETEAEEVLGKYITSKISQVSL